MINLLSKNYNEESKKWEHKEILLEIKMPRLKSKNQASSNTVPQHPLFFCSACQHLLFARPAYPSFLLCLRALTFFCMSSEDAPPLVF
jgi:hypothetical protein